VTIRVLLADDHPTMRAGLSQLLAAVADIEVVGAAADGQEAVGLAAEQRPDVILMDLQMPVLDGIEATRQIVEAGSEGRIVILTSFSDRERIVEALDAGAIGYLLKDAEPDELLRGIRAAARGDSPLAPKVASAVLRDRLDRDRPEAELTVREREVLELIAQGLPNKQIALRLEISEKTVKAHLTKIYQAIDVTDRTQAALWAERHGIGGS
jgi:DNA-binding NarL/FixJ family response regulator